MRVPRRAVAGLALVAVAGVGWAGYAAAAADPAYRTALARVGDLEETLDLAGTVQPAGRADLAFATSGTIARLGVAAGDRVRAGQVLGVLDDESLRRTVQRARAALAAARARLESDLAAQAAAVSGSSGGSSAGSSGGPTGGPSADAGGTPGPDQEAPASEAPTPQGAGQPDRPEETQEPEQPGEDSDALAALAEQQRAVLAAQSAVSASLAAAQQALAAQQDACADVTSQGCVDALAAVQTAQQQVATDQQTLQDALDVLGSTLSAASGSASATSTSAGSTGTAVVLVAETDPGGVSGGTGGTVTAATLARDQAAIDQAKADLVAAQQQLATATVTAPFAGRVVAVEAAVGDSVAAGTDVFVLVSRGTTTVQVTATSTQVQQLEVGQAATATPAGADRTLAGTVTQVSSVPDDDATYAVTVTLKRKRLEIATGLTASVDVVTGTASEVVTVPASAVSDGTVTVLEGGVATPTPVTTGVVGDTRVEIVDGLSAGDEVALADLDQPLPTGDESGGRQLRFSGGPGAGLNVGGSGGLRFGSPAR